MVKRHFFMVVPLLFAAFIGISCSQGMPPEFPAPDFTVEDIFTGKQIHLAALNGKPVMLYFFASW